MLDMGFIPDLERIFKLTPAKKQTLFFSATMPPEITRLTKQFLRDPVRIEASRPATTAETITQNLVRIPTADPKAKRTALRELIARADVKNGIVFCNRKAEVDVVAKSLKKHGLDAAPIHGDLDQQTRMKTLESFRNGSLRLLCASDVAARGLDIPDVSHVFNYDVPHHADDYVHRIGRTGRAGKTGQAFTIVTPADSRNLDKVLKLINTAPVEITLEGIDWSSIKDEPRSPRSGGRDRGPARSRERPARDHAPREARPPREEVATSSVEPAPAAATPERSPRPERTRRPRREDAPATPVAESAPATSPAPRPQRPLRSESPTRSEPQARPDRGRGRERSDGDGDNVVGFGNDLPAFLMRAPPVRKSDD
jgi:superfamily II DNA/RNA helicase